MQTRRARRRHVTAATSRTQRGGPVWPRALRHRRSAGADTIIRPAPAPGRRVLPRAVGAPAAPVTPIGAAGCWPGYQPGRELGKGSFGEVVEACRGPADCKYAVKRVVISGPISPSKAKRALEGARRDAFFLERLANATVDGQPMVPRFFGYWECFDPEDEAGFANISMDRWDGDMDKLAKRQGEGLKLPMGVRGVLYTLPQLLRMFRLMYALGLRRISHGDAKPDAFLQRGEGREMVIADFGFAGGKGGGAYSALVGWSGNDPAFACPPLYGPLGAYEERFSGFPIQFNVWQLEAYMLVNAFTYVAVRNSQLDVPDPGLDPDTMVAARFGGIRDLPHNALFTCRGYADVYKELIADIDKEPHVYSLFMDDLH